MKTNKLKGSDLRIGNLVKYCNGVYRIIEVSPIHLLVQNANDINDIQHRAIQNAEPIELTEEVLVKIGFEKHDEAMNIYAFENERAIVVYVPNRKLLKIEGVENDVLIDRNIRLNNIKYLHQLQNAYYCLTNEELEVEL